MSAGQPPRKRPTSSSLPPDHHRSRPKRPRLDQSPLLSLNPHVRLRWDGASRRVVPAEAQIGIPWSRLAPFVVDAPPRRRASRLADVVPVPSEVFSLENLRRVLSYEVWDKFLTEADIKFLAQFLPTGTNTEETVHALLTGKNHHFGNTLLSWSSALCYGHLHPDIVLAKERQIRADKKAYRAQINDYHSDMTDTLTKWKEKWLTGENPESLFRDNPAKQKKGDRGENIISSKGPTNAIPMKLVRNGDVTKFMSYIKITKSQHELVKRLKQSGDGIQTRHLTNVIGDIDSFHVKPFETLMEDEKKKLHAYWAILSRKELPAAAEARWERRSMAENLRTSLCLELAERSVPAVEEAEQVADRTAYHNGGISDEQEELVDHSPDVPQAGHNSSAVPEDEGDNDTSDTDTSTDSHDSTDQDVKGTSDTGTSTDSHDSPNMSDQDAMDMNNTNITTQSQNSADEQDQELEKTSGMNTSAKSGNNSDRQDNNMEDTSCKEFDPCTEDDDMEDTSCKDTALQDRSIPDMRAQEPKAMSHRISPIKGLNSPSMLVQDCTNTSYTGFPIHRNGDLKEQTDDLKNLCYPSASAGLDNKKEMNHMILDQRETASTTSMASDSTLLFSKTFSKQNNVEEGPELNGPVKYQEVLWQSISPVGSFYRPPRNNMYVQTGALQLKHHISAGPATSMTDLGLDARRRQQAQITVAAASPMCNPASLLPPCTNQLTSEQLLNSANGIYSVGQMNGLKQSVDLHSMTNCHLAQSGLVQEQMQLLDDRHNGLYSQQVENMYPGSALSAFPMVVPQNLDVHAPMDRSSSWFPTEQPSHNSNWSGMESNGMALGHDLPSGDGSLSSVLSQYKQVSSHLSNSEQFIGRRNLVPPRGAQGVAGSIVPPSPDVYAYTQNNMASSHPITSSQADGSLQWAQGSHGMALPSPFRQFGGDPWSR